MQEKLKKILYILCGLCAFVLGMKQLREPDIWWQLLSGRWMLEHGAITRTDTFSYTMQGHPWINIKWLYEILIATFEKAMGPESVILLQALVNVAIVCFLFRTIAFFKKQLNEHIPAFAGALAVLIFLAISEYRMAGRPEMVSHLLCTIYLFILWRNPQLNWKNIWILIPLQCLWANMHEAYPVGIVIIGASGAGSLISYLITKDKAALQQLSRATVLLVACLLIILCNPNGIQLWKQPFEIYRQVWANKYTTELYSIKDVAYWTIQAKWHIAIMIFVFIYWSARIIKAIKTDQVKTFFTPLTTSYIVLLPLFTYLSLDANRNIPFAQIVFLPSVSAMLIWLTSILKIDKMGIYRSLSTKALPIGIAITAIFYISIISNRYYTATGSVNRYGIHVSAIHNPLGAADFIEQHNIKGPAFSDYFISSYMLWDRYPSFRSYIDLRDLDVFPVSFFDDYFSLYTNPNKFESLNKRYDFNYAVISTSQLSALQRKLYWGDDFYLIYADPVAAIYLRSNAANQPLINNTQIQKIFNWPAAEEDPLWAKAITNSLNPLTSYSDEDEARKPIHAAMYYNELGSFPVSIQQLLPAMSELQDDAQANMVMAATYFKYAEALKPGPQKMSMTDSGHIFLERVKQLDPQKLLGQPE